MPGFSLQLLQWQRTHGRHGLPWQNTRDPYRVWLSEIMLQQTQVKTVLTYYDRFLARFPDVQALAAAPADDVLALWSGLGYYSRARNLHRCAQQVCEDHGGFFPSTATELQQLSGIGPSTAAAIAAFCFDERVSILDGNVKRVLSRFAGVSQDIGQTAGLAELTRIAAEQLPRERKDMPVYTQALMDLGATVCTPRQPLCGQCPVSATCMARAQEMQAVWPIKAKRTTRRSERWWLLWCVRTDGAVWLQRRSERGIWAGLYAPPVFDHEDALLQALTQATDLQALPVRKHVLTHRDLYLHDMRISWSEAHPHSPIVNQGGQGAEAGAWYSPSQWAGLGLPAPVRVVLDDVLTQVQVSPSSR